MDSIFLYDSPLGPITLAGDGEALTGLWFEGQKYFGETLSEQRERRALPVFDQAAQWLEVYFSGRDPGPPPPLRPEGTAFRRRVWRLLMKIPYGQTATYAQLARQLEGTGSWARAVGGAAGHNPISLMIPCHRAVGARGGLTGYAGGLERKRRLLEMEGSKVSGSRL